jgi:hypothetical protein
LVATWLNFLAGNNVGDDDAGLDTDQDPWAYIEAGVRWLQSRSPNEGGTAAGDGSLTVAASTWATPAGSNFWGTSTGGLPAGNAINGALDGYNNTGKVNGITYAVYGGA